MEKSFVFDVCKENEVKFSIAGEMPTVKEEHVESLGHWYQIKVVEIQEQVGLKSINETKLPGKYKIWYRQLEIYPCYVATNDL